jgi:hypothetical protein
MSDVSKTRWTLDETDPRAPEADVWAAMTDDERRDVIDSLPSEFTLPNALPPEGDDHYRTTSESRDTLNQWFTRRKHRVYVSGNIAVYYPGQRVFAPDVIAVRDVDPTPATRGSSQRKGAEDWTSRWK